MWNTIKTLLGMSSADPVSSITGAVESVVSTGAGLISTQEKRSEQDERDLASARSADSPSSHTDWFNAAVDGINRLQRPAWGVYFFGSTVKWWSFPEPSSIDPVWFTYLTLYLTFLFGGRAILQDLPKGIAAAMKVFKK